jgi:uncharacterized protein (DUF608 family)
MSIKRLPHTREALSKMGPPRTFRGRELEHIAFPLGGIGTGCVSLAGNGSLRDWEIFNRPSKGRQLPGTFFALWAKPQGRDAVARVLKGPGILSLVGSGDSGDRSTGGGLAHFRNCAFTGRMPFATVEMDEPGFPIRVTLEAFNPCIPQNDKDSSIPCAIFLYLVRNMTRAPVDVTLNANLLNAVGTPEAGENVNEYVVAPGIRGLRMTSRKHEPDSPRFGSMALATPWKNVTYLTAWPGDFGLAGLNRFWESFRKSGRLGNVTDATPSSDDGSKIGALALHARLKPGETVVLPAVIAWHFPNYQKQMDWGQEGGAPQPIWRNYYATPWNDAWDVARYTIGNLKRLESESRAFQDALFGSSLPSAVIDAVASQATILKTTTCLRLTDGTFWGFEGCNDQSGCCPGTCTHVWNYAQTAAYLFPSLERGARAADYRHDLAADGHMTFRMPLPLGTPGGRSYHAAADGQHGGILRAYREWLISGDDDFLREVWPGMKKAMAYTWRYWDADRDGVMEGVQHNTYDIEFWGPNSMLGSYYLAALRAMEEIARRFGETSQAEEYRRLFDSGRVWIDAHLFNGEFYEQQVEPNAARDPHGPGPAVGAKGEPLYQYGPGCLSDQVIGEWYAAMLGLGPVLDPKHVRKTLASIFKHNWREEFFGHDNPQRIYAVDDDKGLILCSWPRGNRPDDPFFYSDEVWTGIEYQVASHLIYSGMVDEGLAIVKGVRDRHDGARRNPWDEIECGHHYARAMASYAVLLALSGFRYSAPDQTIGFDPRINAGDSNCFWAVGSGWGTYRQTVRASRATAEILPIRGSLAIRRLELPEVVRGRKKVTATLGRRALPVVVDSTAVIFARPTTLRSGKKLVLTASR